MKHDTASAEPVEPVFPAIDALLPGSLRVVEHFCGGPCRGYGMVTEACEVTDDREFSVVCGACDALFSCSVTEIDELRRWTDMVGDGNSCGIKLL